MGGAVQPAAATWLSGLLGGAEGLGVFSSGEFLIYVTTPPSQFSEAARGAPCWSGVPDREPGEGRGKLPEDDSEPSFAKSVQNF